MVDENTAMKDLDDLFAEARSTPPELPAQLRSAILSDAQMTRDFLSSDRDTFTPPERPRGLLSQLVAVIGGTPALGGLIAASAVGLWIGLTPPSFLPDPAELVGLANTDNSIPFDSYELATLLTEETQ